ncbi:MAG: triose-phosphate isomerase [Spirochaetia bacterium]
MKKKLIAGNWKMNKTPSEAEALIKEILPLAQASEHDVMVAPAYVCLPQVISLTKGSKIKVLAQDVSQHLEGAYTGEVSISMLVDLGVEGVILGHSERRQYHGETDAIINSKLGLCLKHNLIPIVCVGETLDEREAGKAFDVVETQLKISLANIEKSAAASIVIAYEPVWAIGTGKTASSAQAEEVHQHIRTVLGKLFSEEVAAKIAIQYGGSVKPDNIVELMGMPNIDGALVGGASLQAASFGGLIKF